MTRSLVLTCAAGAMALTIPACQGETIGVQHFDLATRGGEVVDLAVSGLSNCALTASGRAFCWGENQDGGLGDGTAKDSGAPVRNIVADDFVSIDGRCGVRRSGQLACWGHGIPGQHPSPFAPLSNIVAATGEGMEGCAIREGGEVVCWSSIPDLLLAGDHLRDYYQDPDNHPGEIVFETQTKVAGKHVTDIASVDLGSICALVGSGEVYCWYSGEIYWDVELGLHRVEGIDHAVAVDGPRPACAVLEDGHVKCWGQNLFGQLGNGQGWVSPYLRESKAEGDVIYRQWQPGWDTVYPPGLVAGIDDAISVTVGREFACALREGGRVSCWGNNERGQLGDGTFVDRWTPVEVEVLDAPAVAIDAGAEQVCAITVTGEVTCWGSRRLLTDDNVPDGYY